MPGDYSQLKAIQDDLANAASSTQDLVAGALADAQHAGDVAAAAATPGPGLAQFLQSAQQAAPAHRIQAAADRLVHLLVDGAIARIMRGGR